MVYGQSLSFYDELLEQVGEMELSDQERYVLEYLIRSLDDDGFLRTPLENIADELAIYHNIDLSADQLEPVLKKLQCLDPPGVGARTLQECLLLQVKRKEKSETTNQMKKILTDFFDEFTKKHWDKITQLMGVDELQAETLFRELRRLNPKPGAAMGEAMGRSMQQITPDFIVDTQDDGTVTFSLNNGDVPQLQVSQSFADLLKEYQNNKEGLSRQMKEALLYTKQKVDAAQSFIDAVKVRRRTLTLTMKTIIQLQHRFFEEGDEALLRPMILKDVAERTGLDLSTVSRVSNSKYVQTRWGIFPLKYFFSDGYVTENGEELSTREIKAALRELVDAENKRKPMSDDALSEALKEKGYPIARRTVAKYREQLGIPIARLRK
jgi:RNA polymerase sigma-54 factor